MAKRVVIVGMGFGGIRAARALAGNGVDLLLVDRNNYHLFQPLLYQVATAALEQESIAYSARAMVRHWPGARFQLSEVTGFDLDRRRVLTERGELAYDYLIVGAGSVTNFFGMQSVERNAFDLKQLSDGEALRNQILRSFEEAVAEVDVGRRRGLMTFVIVGAGPTGVEFAGALIELIHYVLAKDYPELSIKDARVILVEAGDKVLAAMPGELSGYALGKLREMSVEVLLNARVVEAGPDQVILSDGTVIPCHTLVWSAGVKAAPLAGALGNDHREKRRGGDRVRDELPGIPRLAGLASAASVLPGRVSQPHGRHAQLGLVLLVPRAPGPPDHHDQGAQKALVVPLNCILALRACTLKRSGAQLLPEPVSTNLAFQLPVIRVSESELLALLISRKLLAEASASPITCPSGKRLP